MGMIVSVIFGAWGIVTYHSIAGPLVIGMLFIILSIWITSLLLYGFGELIENTAVTAELMVKADTKKNNAEYFMSYYENNRRR